MKISIKIYKICAFNMHWNEIMPHTVKNNIINFTYLLPFKNRVYEVLHRPKKNPNKFKRE